MSKVLVDPAALEEAAKWLEVHSSSSGSAEAFAADALREAIGQPAEAEGVEVVAYGMPNSAPGKAPRMMMVAIDIPGDDQYGGQLWEPLVRQSALSAVTAERDNYKSWYDDAMDASNIAGFAGMSAAQVIDYQDKEIMQLRAEVEALRKDAELYRQLRDLAVSQLGLPGVPCVAVPEGPKAGRYVSGPDLDAAMAAKEA